METTEDAIAPLLRPFRLRGLSLRNRIMMAPMTRGFSPGGVPGEDVAGYYRRRAEGETGLIVTEGVAIDHPAALGGGTIDALRIPWLHGDAQLAGWKQVTDAVHAAGGVIFPQLWHQGAMREQGRGPNPDEPTISPSGSWGPTGGRATVSLRDIEVLSVPSQPMSDEVIADVIAGFARSARYAMAAGFDGIAIHGAHGYLIDNFLWSGTNRRDDKWGGDQSRRATFAAELVRAVRAAIGAEPVIMFRFSQWKQQDVHAKIAETPDALTELLGPISDAGVDLFDASQRYFDTPEFAGSPLNLTGWAKKVTGKPSVTVGGVGLTVGHFDSAEARAAALSDNLSRVAARLDRGEFDLVGVGRMLLHDPFWTAKLRRDEPLPSYDDASRMVLT